MIKQAIILVGGKGTRLGDLTKATPKPLLEVESGIKFLDVVIENFARFGFNDIILLAGFCGEQIEEAYRGKNIHGAQIRVIIEPEPQGTGGALLFAREYLDDWFVVANGDSIFDFNLREFARDSSDGFIARLALRQVPDPARYGAVTLEGDKITAFLEKNPGLKGPALINGGIYLLSRNVLDLIDGPCSIEANIFPKLVEMEKIEGQEYNGYFLDMGLPDSYAQSQREIPVWRKKPCLFLDRDGVINVDKGYTYKPEDLNFIDGIENGIKAANEAGYYVIVVTNQAGVARGYYTLKDTDAFHVEIQERLANKGAHVDAFYSCPYHKDGNIPEYTIDDHPDRKPNPGMLLKAFNDWSIDKENSFLIGDKDHDVTAAERAGIKGILFEGQNLEQLIKENLNAKS